METTITGLTADQEFHVVVTAIDDQGLVSGLSNVVTAMTVDWQTINVNVEGTGDYRTIEAAYHTRSGSKRATNGHRKDVGSGQ